MNISFFNELLNDKSVNKELIQRLFIHLNSGNEFEALLRNPHLLKHLVENEYALFRRVVDKFKSTRQLDALTAASVIVDICNCPIVDVCDLKYFLKKLTSTSQIRALVRNINLLLFLCNRGLFREVVDCLKRPKSQYWLESLFDKEEFFEIAFAKSLLSFEDIKYLLNSINKSYEIEYLCRNQPLLEFSLKNYLIYTTLLNNIKIDNGYFLIKKDGVFDISQQLTKATSKAQNLFDVLRIYIYHRQSELLDLVDFYEKLYESLKSSYRSEQFDELLNILDSSENARDLFTQIVMNNIFDQYDFKSLKNILTKDETKKKIKMNF